MTAITNGSGYFRITDASLDKNTSLVTAEKAGYFKGYRVFAATSGTNQVVIKLLKKNLAGTIAAASGGSASLPNGAKISLPVNSVVLATSGGDYAGDVKVYASYIDPTAGDIAETVPGSFVANDKNGKRVILSSFGMLGVELESDGGEKLQVKSTMVATLTSPIPSGALSSAPATIALWYVDEQTGIWKEEGTATKQGNNYVGDVKHFSFWNCDYPFDVVSLSMTLRNDKGLPLVNVPVKISLSDTGIQTNAYGYTDSLGQVSGLVPANKKLLLEILDPCDIAVYSKSISPLNKNTDLGTITITNTNSSFITFAGTLLDCSGLPVKKGYAIVNFNNIIRYAATDAGGKYVTNFVICSGVPASASILGVNETSQQQGTTNTVTVTAPLTDAGNITVCGISTIQYMNYKIDGTDYRITNTTNDSSTNANTNSISNSLSISGYQDSTNNLGFSVNNVSASGTYPVSILYILKYRSIILTAPFNVTFTGFPTMPGEFYEGTLSGKFTADSLPAVHTVSASFKVIRRY